MTTALFRNVSQRHDQQLSLISSVDLLDFPPKSCGSSYETEDRVWSLACRPVSRTDGQTVVISFASSGEKRFRLWEVTLQKDPQTDDLHLPESPCCRCVWTSSERVSALGNGESTDVHTKSIRRIRWSDDGQFLGAASFDGTATVWRFTVDPTNQSVGVLSLESRLVGHENELKAIAFSPNAAGSFLAATCSRDKTVWIHETEGMLEGPGAALGEFFCSSILTGHSQDVKDVLFRPSPPLAPQPGDRQDIPVHIGTLVASASYDNSIKLWSKAASDDDYSCIQTLSGHAGTVWSLAFRKCGMELASASADGKLRIWRDASAVRRLVLRRPAAGEDTRIDENGCSLYTAHKTVDSSAIISQAQAVSLRSFVGGSLYRALNFSVCDADGFFGDRQFAAEPSEDSRTSSERALMMSDEEDDEKGTTENIVEVLTEKSRDPEVLGIPRCYFQTLQVLQGPPKPFPIYAIDWLTIEETVKTDEGRKICVDDYIAAACGDNAIRLYKRSYMVPKIKENTDFIDTFSRIDHSCNWQLVETIQNAHDGDVNTIAWLKCSRLQRYGQSGYLLCSGGDDTTIKIWFLAA